MRSILVGGRSNLYDRHYFVQKLLLQDTSGPFPKSAGIRAPEIPHGCGAPPRNSAAIPSSSRLALRAPRHSRCALTLVTDHWWSTLVEDVYVGRGCVPLRQRKRTRARARTRLLETTDRYNRAYTHSCCTRSCTVARNSSSHHRSRIQWERPDPTRGRSRRGLLR
jgi:hypothetical protein